MSKTIIWRGVAFREYSVVQFIIMVRCRYLDELAEYTYMVKLQQSKRCTIEQPRRAGKPDASSAALANLVHQLDRLIILVNVFNFLEESLPPCT